MEVAKNQQLSCDKVELSITLLLQGILTLMLLKESVNHLKHYIVLLRRIFDNSDTFTLIAQMQRFLQWI